MRPKFRSASLSTVIFAGVIASTGLSQAQTTYTWANSNVAGVPATSLNWFNATQGTWTGGTPVSSNLNTIQFFQDTATALPNDVGSPGSTQASIVDNGGTSFQLGTLTLSGRGSSKVNGHMTMDISGDALSFSAATGTINLDSINTSRLVRYNVANNLQLGTASSGSVLTFQGNGGATHNGAIVGSNNYAFNGIISELQAGGGSIVKTGTSTLVLGGSNTFTGGTTISGGGLFITSQNALGAARADRDITVSEDSSLGANNSTTYLLDTLAANSGTFTVNNSTSKIFSFQTTTGAGTIAHGGNGNGTLNLGNASGFTGTLRTEPGSSSTGNVTFTSLGDAGSLQAGSGTAGTGNATLLGDVGALTFNTRTVGFTDNTNTTALGLINNNATAANAWVINTNLTAGAAANAKTLALSGTNIGENKFAGTIGDTSGGGVVSITKSAVGNWSISNAANTFTGAITLSSTNSSAGTLSYASAGGANAITFLQTTGSANLAYTGSAAQTMSGLITASALTTGTITLDASGTTSASTINYSNAASLSSVSTNTGARKVILTGSNTGENIFNGAIANNSGTGGTATLTKNGAGTWVLAGTNTYTGATNVAAGTLLINGSTSTLSAVTVNAGTLGGTGTIGGSVSVISGAALSPGASIESLATDALTMASNSTFAYEVLDNSATGADLLAVGGTISLTAVNFSLDSASLLALAGGSWTVGDKLTLISYGGTAITSGFVGYTDDTNYSFGSNVWTFNYDDTAAGSNFATDLTGANRITLTAFTVIPEPSTALLGALGVLALLRRKR